MVNNAGFGEMRLQIKPRKKGSKTRGCLIKYYDNRWLSVSELALTPESLGANLDVHVIRMRLKKNIPETLEKLLSPKRGYVRHKKSISSDFEGVSQETMASLKSGNNLKLLKGNDNSVKIRGTLSIPNVYKKPLITKELKVDKEKYYRAKDKDEFLFLSFIHAISNSIKVDCSEIIECD